MCRQQSLASKSSSIRSNSAEEGDEDGLSMSISMGKTGCGGERSDLAKEMHAHDNDDSSHNAEDQNDNNKCMQY